MTAGVRQRVEGEGAGRTFLTTFSEAALPCKPTPHRSESFGDFYLRWGLQEVSSQV